MEGQASSIVGQNLLELVQHILPEGTPDSSLNQHHSFSSRLLSSQMTPKYAQDESDTHARIHDLVRSRNNPNSHKNVGRVHECLKKLQLNRKTLTRRWAILRTLYKISEQQKTPETASTALFKVNNAQNYRHTRMDNLMDRERPINQTQRTQQKMVPESSKHKAEKQIIRELLFMFQGVGSKYMMYLQKDKVFKIDPVLDITYSNTKIVLGLCEIAWLFSRISDFLNIQTNAIRGLTFQSLCYAVKEELNEYYYLIAILESARTHPETELDLQKLRLWTLEPFRRIKWISVLTEICENLKGGELLSALYSYCSHGMPQLQELANRILRKTLEPFLNFLQRWVYSGELVDPMGEFFIEQNEQQVLEDRFWGHKYEIRSQMIPAFISAELATDILVAGKTKTFMRKFCGEGSWTLQEEFIRFENLISFSYMEGSKFKAFQNWVKNVRAEADHCLKTVILKKFKFMQHFTMIKKFLLLYQGDFINTLMELMKDELQLSSSKIFRHSLISLLEMAKTTSSTYKIGRGDLERVGVRLKNPQPGDVGWDIFSLDYTLQSPLSSIFSSQTMNKYADIFNFFWKVKRLEFILNEVWMMHKKHSRFAQEDEMSHSLNLSNLIRHQMLHFVKTFFSYLMLEVVETEWNTFNEGIKKAASMDDIITLHNTFVDNLQQKSIAKEVDSPLRIKLKKLLELIHQFERTQELFFQNLEKRQINLENHAAQLEEDGYSENSEDMHSRASYNEDYELYAQIFEKTNKMIEGLWSEFRSNFDEFLQLLEKNQSTKSLAFKLDFNEYYKYKRSSARNRQEFSQFVASQHMDIEQNSRHSNNPLLQERLCRSSLAAERPIGQFLAPRGQPNYKLIQINDEPGHHRARRQLRHRAATRSAGQQARKVGDPPGERDHCSVHRRPRNICRTTSPPRARGPPQDLRRHPWTVLRSSQAFTLRGVPPRLELPFFGRLRRPRKTEYGNHLIAVGLQDQVPRKLLFAAGQPRVFLNQPDLRLLRRMQEEILHLAVEDFYGVFQLPASLRTRRRQDSVHARWTQS